MSFDSVSHPWSDKSLEILEHMAFCEDIGMPPLGSLSIAIQRNQNIYKQVYNKKIFQLVSMHWREFVTQPERY